MISDSAAIANTFNDYFVSIEQKLTYKMPNNASFKKYLGDENPNSIFLRPTCELEILKIIGIFYRKKSSGPDLISVNLVKACAEHLSNQSTC